MELEINYQNFFLKEKEEQELIQDRVKGKLLKKDKYIAKFLGLEKVEWVYMIRQLLDTYRWIEHKKARNLLITKEETDLVEMEIENTRNNKISFSPQNPYRRPVKTKCEGNTEFKKDLLLHLECGTTDYRVVETGKNLKRNELQKKRPREALIEEKIMIDGIT